MKAILNHKIIETDKIPLSLSNRGLRYGDGLFETIVVIRGVPRFLSDHLNRLKKGSDILNLDVTDLIKPEKIHDEISALAEQNNISGDASVKLMIWRNTDGKYTPDGSNADMMLTIKKHFFEKITINQNGNFSAKTTNYPSMISRFKTLSALKYVIAGIEKKERDLDEIIILDQQGYISEALSSNIFWKKSGSFFTPPLSTGCIEGVMRNRLIKQLSKDGYIVEEKLAKTSELLSANCIFTTNANGIGHIKRIEDHDFKVDPISQSFIESIS